MHLWYTLFRHVDVLPGMPQFNHVFCSSRGPGYYDSGRDRHDTGYAFQYTLKGEGVLRIRGRERRLPVGTGFFRRVDDPDLEHYYPRDAETSWQFVFCDLEAIGFSSMADAIIGSYGHVFEIPPAHPFIQRLLSYRQPQDGNCLLTLNENLQVITDLLTALSECAPERRPAGGHPKVDEALRLIRNADPDLLNVTWLAAKLAISREHLARLFNAHLQRTPHSVITEQRVKIARQLLAVTDLEIQHVAFQCGFGRAEFSSWFRRQCGQSPGAFRRDRPG